MTSVGHAAGFERCRSVVSTALADQHAVEETAHLASARAVHDRPGAGAWQPWRALTVSSCCQLCDARSRRVIVRSLVQTLYAFFIGGPKCGSPDWLKARQRIAPMRRLLQADNLLVCACGAFLCSPWWTQVGAHVKRISGWLTVITGSDDHVPGDDARAVRPVLLGVVQNCKAGKGRARAGVCEEEGMSCQATLGPGVVGLWRRCAASSGHNSQRDSSCELQRSRFEAHPASQLARGL